MSSWNNPQTAQKYEAYAQKHPMYRATNRDLVRLAELTENMQLIDLCCGTGITSEAILKKLKSTGHLYAVDLSPAMLSVAREKITADNISFHKSPAEKVNSISKNPVDRILCNSAFWQLNIDETLKAVHEALKQEGYFAFNLPGAFYDIPNDDNNRQETPRLRTEMRRIAEQDYGYRFLKSRPINAPQLNYENMLEKFAVSGLTLHHYEVISYQQSQSASLEFCTIPIMTERILPDVDYTTRMEILKKATATNNPKLSFTQNWAYFIAKPIT